jgi:phage tail-like protein
MTGPTPTFRLLDGRTGWDPRPGDGLARVTLDGGALRLAPAATPSAEGGGRPGLARSRDGTWWLAGRPGIRRLGPCDAEFRPWPGPRRVRDLAVRGRRLALVTEAGRIVVLGAADGQWLADARVPEAVRVDLTGDGGLVVTDRWGRRTSLDPSGLVCASDPPCRPGDPMMARPTAGHDWPAGAIAGLRGFILPGRGTFDWRGQTMPGGDVGRAGTPREPRGQLLTAALDSGITGCRWHRIRLDAELPDGTGLEAAFATTDGPAEGRVPAATAPGPWSGFPAGDPNPTDWFTLPAGALDSTLGAAPGRYGYLRLRLTGDGRGTPVVHQVRLDLPRAAGLDHLPAVYAEDPRAADFTERFLSLFDAQLEHIDEALARRSALLDADALPDDALGWLAGLLGTGFEAEMPVANRRALLRAAPKLFRDRGTPQGLVDTLRVALGVPCTVEELGTARPWGAVGRAHLGSVRLFSRSVARVRLGTSRLGSSRLEGRGNPDLDAMTAGAHRIRVHVPAGTDTALVARVVRSQIPAHVVFSVRAATAGFVASTLRLGVDTVLTTPAPAAVGDVALGRRGVVGAGRRAGAALVVGREAGSTATGDKRMECPC